MLLFPQVDLPYSVQLHVFGNSDTGLACICSIPETPIFVQVVLFPCDVLQPCIAAMLAYVLSILPAKLEHHFCNRIFSSLP